jgi:hypothetical protein
MTTHTRHSVAPHAAVQSFIARNSLSSDDVRADGRLSLTLDGKFRVHLHSAGPAWVALTTDLMALSKFGRDADADDVLERLMNMSAGLLRGHSSALVMDARRGTLMLQLSVPANASGDELENALAEFVNVLPFWQSACAEEIRFLHA